MRKREAPSFYDDFSIRPKPRAAPAARPRWAPKVNLLPPRQELNSSVRAQELNELTFLKSQPTLPVRDVTYIPGHILYPGFLLWHLWMTRPLRARVNTCAHVCTWLTHALSRKVLSLTKPKGKIYKTKSLGHYITIYVKIHRREKMIMTYIIGWVKSFAIIC